MLKIAPQKYYVFFLAVLIFGLSACGIRPDSVEPAPGAEDIVFPQPYPNPDGDL